MLFTQVFSTSFFFLSFLTAAGITMQQQTQQQGVVLGGDRPMMPVVSVGVPTAMQMSQVPQQAMPNIQQLPMPVISLQSFISLSRKKTLHALHSSRKISCETHVCLNFNNFIKFDSAGNESFNHWQSNRQWDSTNDDDQSARSTNGCKCNVDVAGSCDTGGWFNDDINEQSRGAK